MKQNQQIEPYSSNFFKWKHSFQYKTENAKNETYFAKSNGNVENISWYKYYFVYIIKPTHSLRPFTDPKHIKRDQ